MNRLLLASVATLGCIILTGGVLLGALLLELPSAVVCDRGPSKTVNISSTRAGGYFVEHRIGPCVAYTHESRAVPGGGGD
jgi:hypothetical protein